MSDPPCGDFHVEDGGASLVPQLPEEPGQLLAVAFFGFIPGNYVVDCHCCPRRFSGDKHSTTCLDCATAMATVATARAQAARSQETATVVSDTKPSAAASLVPARLRPLPISRAMAHAGARVLRTFTGDDYNVALKVFAAMDAVRREEAG